MTPTETEKAAKKYAATNMGDPVPTFKAGAEWMAKQKDQEIARLHRVIAKELSENDELGTEYTYVNALKAEVERLKGIK